ncbi:hypothetical protein ABIE89_006950 [Bradyrhizobium niftali]|uniref:DUF3102 domain-containing protein n=1 Tax=Bradyrhizobium niftali TaxID=2560055 RepID=UPI00383718BA
MTQTQTVDGSNSLADLAARIRVEHEATSDALRSSAEHGMAAGDLLVEAKAKVPHGQWLPWLKDNCAMSERTAQLYMRLAKNREAIEEQIRNGSADLSMNEAAALLMLSSDVRKLLEMAKTMKGLQGDDLIDFCIANEIGMLKGNIFGAPEPTDQEMVEWEIYILWLVRRQSFYVEGAALHADWVRSRGTLLVDWMKPHPIIDRWRTPIPQAAFDDWYAFLEDNRGRSLDDVTAELKALDKSRGPMPRPSLSRKRKAQ